MLNFSEVHFFGLPSQSNVYGLTKVCTTQCAKLLVATLRRQVFTIEFMRSSGALLPTAKEVHFTYIPGDANIISIDAFSKSDMSNDFVVGITFIKNAENQASQQYFNIYWEPGSEFNLDTIAQSCTSLQLTFVPFKLYHTRLLSNEVVWLLSGSDCQIHLYREDKKMNKFMERPVTELFPEFKHISSVVLSIDAMNCERQGTRVTAFGCDNGFIGLFLVNVRAKEILKKWSTSHDAPISSLKLFTPKNKIIRPKFFKESEENIEPSCDDVNVIQLLVTTPLEVSVVYMNVCEKGFENQMILPRSNHFDSGICSCVCDVDMDGYNEILLGTYGQELLVYKHRSNWSAMEDVPDSNGATDTFTLIKQRSFASPLHSIKYIDVTGDGLKEIVILAMKGVHILQHSLKDVAYLCEQRLRLSLIHI